MITVNFEPDNQSLTLTGLATVLGLLNKIGKRQTEVLVIREGELLTQDRRLRHGDVITIRAVTSRG